MSWGIPGPAQLTREGGIAVYMTNDTGAVSVKGTVVCTSDTTDNAVSPCPGGAKDPIGVIYDDGVPVGGQMRVVISGRADVLLEDNSAATRGYWCRLSATQVGRCDATLASPPGVNDFEEIDAHFAEIGHCTESVTAGTDKLCRIVIHFN